MLEGQGQNSASQSRAAVGGATAGWRDSSTLGVAVMAPARGFIWRAWEGRFWGAGIILFLDVDGLAPQTGF